MVASIIVAVRSDLMAAIKPVVNAVSGMESVYVDFQYATANSEPREAIWTQNAQVDLANASLRAGRNFSNETTSFDLLFKAWAPNQSAQAAAQRVLDIAEVACAWIADHKNGEDLTNAKAKGLLTLTISGNGTQTESLDNDSVTGRLQLPISYTARLT